MAKVFDEKDAAYQELSSSIKQKNKMAKEDEERQRQLLEFLGTELTALKSMLVDEKSGEEEEEQEEEDGNEDDGKMQNGGGEGSDEDTQRRATIRRINRQPSTRSSVETDWDLGRVKQEMNKLKSRVHLSVEQTNKLKRNQSHSRKRIEALDDKVEELERILGEQRQREKMREREEEHETKREKEREREEMDKREKERKEREKFVEDKLESQARRLRSEHKAELIARMTDHELQIQEVDEENKRLNDRIAKLLDESKEKEKEWKEKEEEIEEEWRKKEKQWREKEEDLETWRRKMTTTTKKREGDGEETKSETEAMKGIATVTSATAATVTMPAESGVIEAAAVRKRCQEAIELRRSASMTAEAEPNPSTQPPTKPTLTADAIIETDETHNASAPSTPTKRPIANTTSSFYVASPLNPSAAAAAPAASQGFLSSSAAVSAASSAAASAASEGAGLSKLQERLRKTMERIVMLETNLQVKGAQKMFSKKVKKKCKNPVEIEKLCHVQK